MTGGVSGAAGGDGKDGDEGGDGDGGGDGGGNDGSTQLKRWCQTVVHAGSNRSFVLLVVASSLLAGVAAGWQGLFQAIMEPAGYDRYDIDIKFKFSMARFIFTLRRNEHMIFTVYAET